MFDGRSGGKGPPVVPSRNPSAVPLILVTGASGYVGGRLVPALEARGYRVRCLARRPEYLAGRFRAGTEVVEGDVLQPGSLASALRGVHTAYYLVHSMGAAGDFEEQDRAGAGNFARAAREQGVRRIIYLGGLGERELSPHLRSRQEVGDILAAEGPRVLEFRASIVIGSGSLSFEMIRALVNKLPVMVTPGWVRTRTQPIAIGDVIAYLVHGLEFGGDASTVVEIGGPDRVSYGELMHEYARQIGVRRLMVPVPFLTTAPVESLAGPRDPALRPGRQETHRQPAERDRRAPCRRAGDLPGASPERPAGDRAGPRGGRPQNGSHALERRGFLERTDRRLGRPPVRFAPGGPPAGRGEGGSRPRVRPHPADRRPPGGGTSRRGSGFCGVFSISSWVGSGCGGGRRHPVELRAGDPLDFWRVEAWEENRLLRLSAEMKVPGRAWLQFEVDPADGGSRITQTAVFDPLGLGGLVYWYGLYPIHWLIFRRILRAVAARAAEPP